MWDLFSAACERGFGVEETFAEGGHDESHSRIVGAIVVALVLGEADLVDSVFIAGIIHRLPQVVVEFGSCEPVSVVIVRILHQALFRHYQLCLHTLATGSLKRVLYRS